MSKGYDFLSLQGSSHLAINIASGVKVLRELGNQTSVEVEITSETYSRSESKTGKRQKIGEWTKAREVNLSITMDEQKPEDIALAFQAQIQEIIGEDVQDYSLGDGLKVGDIIKLDGVNISNVLISDSTAVTPVVLVLGEHYLLDAEYGTIEILKLDGVKQPLVADFSGGDATATVLFTMPDDVDYYYLFKGINSINDKRLMLELWRFKPSVDGKMDFINEETGEINVNGSALADSKKQEDDKLGGFGRLVYLD